MHKHIVEWQMPTVACPTYSE